MKRQPFNLQTAMTEALRWLWKYKAEQRAELEAEGKTGDSWYARHCYTTATELEDRVRNACQEQLDGKPVGEYGLNCSWGSGVRISGLNGISLLDHCRRFLLRSGLDSHNFGRGHVSGERFRAPGMPSLTESEAKTVKAKNREKPVHIRRGEKDWKPLCTADRKSRRNAFSWRTSRTVRVVSDPTKVTCKQCLKRIAAEQSAAVPVEV